MPKKDRRVDAYISKSAEFARPIMVQLREVIHEACPDVEETLKWGMPSFMHHGILCGFAAFKEHATFGFWKGSLILDKNGSRADEAMGQFGRLTSVKDLPPRKTLAKYVKEAARLNEAGIKAPRATRKPKPAPKAPPDLLAAMKKNAKARATYERFSPSMQREYVDWITEAKTEPTRQKRVATTVEWLAEGKQRNWKYMNC